MKSARSLKRPMKKVYEMSERSLAIADRVEAFIRNKIVPYEKDPRATSHGPTDELVQEMRALAREAGVLERLLRRRLLELAGVGGWSFFELGFFLL